MKRTSTSTRALVAAALGAAALALPALAPAASLQGVVVGKDLARGTVLAASGGGAVRTVHAPGRIASLQLGSRVSLTGHSLGDGSFSATALRTIGRAPRASIRAVVVALPARGKRVLLAAGGSLVSVKLSARRGKRGPSASTALRPGAEATFELRLARAGATAERVTQVERVGEVELDGVVARIDGETLALEAPGGPIELALTEDVDVSELVEGDEVGVVAEVAADGTLLLLDAWLLGDVPGDGDWGDDEWTSWGDEDDSAQSIETTGADEDGPPADPPAVDPEEDGEIPPPPPIEPTGDDWPVEE
ncbi:MAG: hypothetical protein R3C15_19185 [Thermoleophilia bacterium]